MSRQRAGAWMARLTACLLALSTLTGCNALTELEGSCDADADCAPHEICDARGGFCRVPTGAATCTLDSVELDCGLFASCSPGGVCQAEDVILALLNNPLGGPDTEHARLQRAALDLVVAEFSERFERFDGRKLRLVHVPTGEGAEARRRALQEAVDRRASIVLTLDTETAVEAQRYARDHGLLVLAQFTTDSRFEQNETPLRRNAYGLIPEPKADLATWASLLREQLACTRVAVVHVAGDADDARFAELAAIYLQGPELTFSGAVTLDPEAPLDGALARLADSGADCAFALPVGDAGASDPVADFLTRWAAEQRGEMRWLFTTTARLDALRQRLDGAALDALTGAWVVRYEIASPHLDRVVEAFDTFYAGYTPACTPAICFDAPAYDVLTSLRPFLLVSYDQGILGALAAYRALHQGPPTRQLLRESLRAINGGAIDELPCNASDPSACFGALDLGATVGYRGASGELRFQTDGRPETLDEAMIFSQVGPDQSLLEIARRDQAAMARALRAASANGR